MRNHKGSKRSVTAEKGSESTFTGISGDKCQSVSLPQYFKTVLRLIPPLRYMVARLGRILCGHC